MVFKRAWTNGVDSIQDTDLEEIGVEFDTKQPIDGDLTAIAALTPANDDVLQRKSGSWINRTIAQLKTDLAITINSLLPTQTSQAGKYLGTDGANPFWGTVSGGGGGSEYPRLLIDDYGSDPSGVAFSDTAVAAALTALGDNPGILEFGVGTYKLNTTILLDRAGQGILGQGMQATFLNFTGTGPCIRAWDSLVPADGETSPGRGGPLIGFTILGYSNTNTTITGIHIGDLMWPHIENVFIEGFNNATSKGLWFEHVRSWSERCYLRMAVKDCTDCYVFETRTGHPLSLSSWMYSSFALSVELGANQNGVILRNGAQMIASDMILRCNATAAATNTGAVLTLGGGFGESGIIGRLDIGAETAGAAGLLAPTDIFFGSGGYLEAYGSIRYSYFGAANFQAGNGSLVWMPFMGPVWAPSLNPGQSASRNYMNKAIVLPSVNAMTFSATPVFDMRLYTHFNMTLTAAITSATFPGGYDGQQIIIRLKDNGTARAIALGSIPRAMSGVTIPTTTVANKTHYIRGIWHNADARLDIWSVSVQP
jgi:hypothetical protein